MLTIDKLKTNAELAKLDASLLTVIEDLSKADEKLSIDKVTRTLHEGYDKDIKAITGLEKPANMQTYQHMSAILKDVWPLKTKVADLEQKIKDGDGDPALKKQIETLTGQIADKDKELETIKGTLDTKTTEFQKTLQDKELEVKKTVTSLKFAEAEKGVVFKDVYGEQILKNEIERRRSDILNNVTIEETDDGQGGKSTILRGPDKTILTNKEDGFKPHTLQSYYVAQLGDLIDTGKKAPGGGSKPPSKADPKVVTLDFSEAKDQFAASVVIDKYLLSKGVKETDPSYGDQYAKIWDDNKVDEMPQNESSDPAGE